MFYKTFTLLFLSAVISACGGDGGGNSQLTEASPSAPPPDSSDPEWQAGVFPNHSNLKNFCASPRSGINPATSSTYPDAQGDALDERNWLRSWSNDFYLWYDEIIDRNPENFETLAYFDVLKTNATTPSGAPRDQFHFYIDSEEYFELATSGTSVSTGANWSIIESVPPREIRVAYVIPDSPADLAGILRGDSLTTIDGESIANSNKLDVLNAGLSPSQNGETHQYTFSRNGSNFTVNLRAQTLSSPAVLQSDVINTATGDVGYIVFNDHTRAAEAELIDTVTNFSNEGVSDLILDLRYNGGGFLFVASELSYMIAGRNNTANKNFESLVFNDKHTQINPFTNDRLQPTPFYTNDTDNNPLPTLDLNRVFVLTSSGTCSASESIINALRGIDVEVIQIGSNTCGKPYGFYPTDNCGTTYFSIHFRGENDKGFGDYADGFTPALTDNGEDQIKGCTVADDLNNALGDTNEAFLEAALFYRDNDSCPSAITQNKQKSTVSHSDKSGLILKNPILQNKLM